MTTATSSASDIRHLYAEDKGITSIVSYPTRMNIWGDARYRGNCDGRLFKDLVLRYKARCVADPMMGSGTTRDVIKGLNEHVPVPIQYWGGDLKSGFDLFTQDLPGKFDFVWVHPPYWNIIEYSNSSGDLSTIPDYSTFRHVLLVCLKRCYAALVPGGRLAVLVADVRRRGTYYPLGFDIAAWQGVLGELRSVIIKAQHNCRSDSIQYAPMEDVPIRHEYCLVFKKPNAPPR